MKIIFSFHAVKRMKERGITKTEVFETIRMPDKLGQKDQTIVAMKKRKNGHLLIVVYTFYCDIYKIITVIDTSKVNKYI